MIHYFHPFHRQCPCAGHPGRADMSYIMQKCRYDSLLAMIGCMYQRGTLQCVLVRYRPPVVLAHKLKHPLIVRAPQPDSGCRPSPRWRPAATAAPPPCVPRPSTARARTGQSSHHGIRHLLSRNGLGGPSRPHTPSACHISHDHYFLTYYLQHTFGPFNL